MKTTNFVLTALALFAAITVSATKFPTLNVIPVEKQKALVAFESPEPAPIEISIRNKEGNVLYCKKSEAPENNFRIIFDFRNLSDGTYDVCLNSSNCKINREVTISKHQLKDIGKQEKEYGPYCRLEDNLLKVSYLNRHQRNVRMNVYRNGQYVAGQNLGKDMCIQKAYDFSKLETGQYKVIFSNRTNNYLFTVNK